MPFPLSLLGSSRSPRKSTPPPRISLPLEDDYDSASDYDDSSNKPSDPPQEPRDRNVYASSSPSYRRSTEGLLLPFHDTGRASRSSSATNSPIPSRSTSPVPQPQFLASAASSSCTSDADSEPTSPLLSRNRKSRWWNDEGQRWWLSSRDTRRKRRRRERWHSTRSIRRFIRLVLRHPLFPTQPTSIVSLATAIISYLAIHGLII